LETLSDALRIIYNFIENGNFENALWEITELERHLRSKDSSLMDKYQLKTYFANWRTRLLRANTQGIRLILNDLDLLIKKVENISID
jgi:hypothetical protein